MRTKCLLLILFFTISATPVFSQNNNMKARIEYEDAETAFQNKEYEKALSHLEKAEDARGKWESRISYLKIISTDKVIKYSNWNEELEKLKEETTKYMQYANENPRDADLEKVREVYTVEEKVNEVWEWKKYLDDERKWINEPDYAEGYKAYKDKDYEIALELFHKSSGKENPAAMNYIGIAYYNGNGVLKSVDEALKWYEKGSKAGNSYSSKNIADIYFDGEYVTQDYKKALEYYHKAAVKGHSFSMIRIAYLNKEGLGTAKNLDEAMKWYKKAADRGDKIGLTGMGLIYALKDDINNAFLYFREAANKGETEAMFYLGLCYEGGEGTSKNTDEAIKWYAQASKDYPGVNIYLARIYYDKRNYIDASQSYSIAINNNVGLEKDDYFKIGKSLFETKSYSRSFEWLMKSYNGRIETRNSAGLISAMYENGLGVQQDKKKAREWRNKY